jgi:hypothetical protein
MNSRYRNQDNDPNQGWKSADPSAPEIRDTGTYAIQSPFTGKLYYPREGRGHRANDAPPMKIWLEGWGSAYSRKDLGDGFAKAMVLKDARFVEGEPVENDPVVAQARKAATKILERGAWELCRKLGDGVVSLRQKDEIDDPLTEILRTGAGKLIVQAVEIEFDTFLALNAGLVLPDGRQRVVRHGHDPIRTIQTGIGPVEVQKPKARDRAAPAAGERIRFTSAILPKWARRTKSLT